MMENIYSNIQYKATFSKAGIKRQTNLLHLKSSGFIWHQSSWTECWRLVTRQIFEHMLDPRWWLVYCHFYTAILRLFQTFISWGKLPDLLTELWEFFYTKGLNFARLLVNEISRLMYCMMYLDTTDTLHVLVSILMLKPRQLTCLWNKNRFPKYLQLYKTGFCVDWCDFFAVDRNM